ncbi:phosphoglycerate mutase 1-like isoform X1 [Thrips palmi]|uniref:phosphoglycerate mutase (2,3-diphosphoglycerate-dependent) n=1 Tax=Thrips palmi TaxID=161013 RepID=A0A6P8Y508_THRPL|nr:phosphoglycerate mutase 1-like isoform X1 [Thrips palmi]
MSAIFSRRRRLLSHAPDDVTVPWTIYSRSSKGGHHAWAGGAELCLRTPMLSLPPFLGGAWQRREEAYASAKMLQEAGLEFDVCHTSLLSRANDTLDVILREIGQPNLPVYKSWRLNERHYGALTGFNKLQTAQKYGAEQVQIWRRSYDIPPPPIEEDHKYYSAIVNNPKFALELSKDQIPRTESLKTTLQRVIPYWEDVIAPQIRQGKRVLIVTHGTSLRGLVKHVQEMSDEVIVKLNLPNAIPFYYDLDENLQAIDPLRFLADEETVRREMEKVASIGK